MHTCMGPNQQTIAISMINKCFVVSCLGGAKVPTVSPPNANCGNIIWAGCGCWSGKVLHSPCVKDNLKTISVSERCYLFANQDSEQDLGWRWLLRS